MTGKPTTTYFVQQAVEYTMRQEDNLADALEAADGFLQQYQEDAP